MNLIENSANSLKYLQPLPLDWNLWSFFIGGLYGEIMEIMF